MLAFCPPIGAFFSRAMNLPAAGPGEGLIFPFGIPPAARVDLYFLHSDCLLQAQLEGGIGVAQVDYFLKVDGAEGESPDSKHKGEIEVQSFSWGVHQEGTSQSGGGAGAGKAAFADFHFIKKYDKASPKLMLKCAGGDHIPKVTLVCRKAGKEQQEYLKITFTDVLVSSYQIGGSGGSDIIPSDSISLNFSKIEHEYKEQKSDGTLGGTTKGGWDLKANKAT
jgi:type VI secretion system secreted protein Hcp